MIIQNAIFIPQLGQYFKSCHTHDYIRFEVDGKWGFIDGGNDYCRAGGSLILNEDSNYYLTDDSTIKDILNKLLWGTRGKDGKQPLTYLPIKDLELDYLKEIKYNVKGIKILYLFVIEYWIKEKNRRSSKTSG